MLISTVKITNWLNDIFIASGCPNDEAILISKHLVDADASGHPSHGIVRVPRYIDYIKNKAVKPKCEYEILISLKNLILLDGKYSFGQVLGYHLINEAKSIVKNKGLALVGLRNAGHLGRIGSWAEILADLGLISIHFVSVAGSKIVAPFGSKEPIFSTAPLTIGIPNIASNKNDHFILDFATSRVAEGKILVSQKTKSKIPKDSMVDEFGKDSSNPFTIYGETSDSDVPNPRSGPGAIQTMGEHKGSGLGLACELLAGAITGTGTNAHNRPFCNGMFSIIIDPKKFDIENSMFKEIEDFITSVRESAPRKDGTNVKIPGDPEREKRLISNKLGINLDETIFHQLKTISKILNLKTPI
mgnify:CR=1 FL=1